MSSSLVVKRLATLAALAGLAATAQAQRVFDSGPTCTVLFNGVATPTLLGFSSGNIVSTGQSQRWLAAPFTLATAQQVTEIGVNGFDPADAGQTSLLGYDSLKYIIWKRNPGNPAPVAADQLFTGSVATASINPGVQDPRGYFANLMLFKIPVNLTLPAGDYYLSVYGDAPNAAGTGDANFAWFTNAQLNPHPTPPNTPIVLSDAGGVFAWRSATFPAPGFARYTNATLLIDPAPAAGPAVQDPQYLYSPSFYLGKFCNPNCDNSTLGPCLNVNDFICFNNAFSAALALTEPEQIASYANYDHSTLTPVLNVNDFIAYNNGFAAGCAVQCANHP